MRIAASGNEFLTVAIGLALVLAGCQENVAPRQSKLESSTSLVKRMAPHAAGLCLATVVEIIEYDERPGDGNQGLRIQLSKEQGSGEFHSELDIVTAFGGHRAFGDTPTLPDLLKPGSFQIGRQYWIAFASPHDLERYPQRVVAWREHGRDSAIDAAFARVVRDDVFRWSPRYDPASGLTYGRVSEKEPENGKPCWRIRVTRESETIWEQTMPGSVSDRYFAWTMASSTALGPIPFPPRCGRILVAETVCELAAPNEFNLPAETVYLQTVFDPESGTRLAIRVSRQQPGDVLLLSRTYDPRSGKVVQEQRPE